MFNPPISLPTKENITPELMSYLAGRCLDLFPNIGEYTFYHNDQLYLKTIATFTRTLDNSQISQITVRLDSDKHFIVYENPDLLVMYNEHQLLNPEITKWIVTESVIDAESINQSINQTNTCAVSFNSASIRESTFIYFLVATKPTDTIYLMLDNDKAGVSKSKQLMDKYGKFRTIKIINYPHDDPNDTIQKIGRNALKSVILTQIQ